VSAATSDAAKMATREIMIMGSGCGWVTLRSITPADEAPVCPS